MSSFERDVGVRARVRMRWEGHDSCIGVTVYRGSDQTAVTPRRLREREFGKLANLEKTISEFRPSRARRRDSINMKSAFLLLIAGLSLADGASMAGTRKPFAGRRCTATITRRREP